MLTLPLSEPVAPHALMAPARRVMSHEYGSTQFDSKIQMSWFLPGSTSSSWNHTLASNSHRTEARVFFFWWLFFCHTYFI